MGIGLAIAGIAATGLLGAFNVQIIPNFNFMGFSFNWFTALCLVGIIWVGVKYGSKNKMLVGAVIVFAVLYMGSNALFGFLDVRKDMARQNATYGSIEYVDVYADFNAFDEIHLKGNDVVFYKSGDKYITSKEYNKNFDFNGTLNKFNLLIDDRPCIYTISSGGILYAYYELSFYDLWGDYICTIPLEIYFTFSVGGTKIEIKSGVSDANYKYLSQFMQFVGLKLRIINEQYALLN